MGPIDWIAQSKDEQEMNGWLPNVVADLDSVGADRVKYLKILGSRLSAPDYDALRSQMFRDHTFWRGLLPKSNPDDAVLVIETRLGGISLGLANAYANVVSVHITESAAEITKHRVRQERRGNVEVVTCMTIDDIPSRDHDYAAIVIYDPESDPTGQWMGEGREYTDDLLLSSARFLRNDGVVLLAGNNRFGYRVLSQRLTQRGRGVEGRYWRTIRDVQRLISRAGIRETDWYGSRTELVAAVDTSLAFTRIAGQTMQVVLLKDWRARAKEFFLRTWFGRQFWPSFLVVAARQPISSAVQVLVEGASGSGLVAGWPVASRARVRRIVAGNESTTVAIVGPAKSDGPEVVVRMPTTNEGESMCATNAQMLTLLRDDGIGMPVPYLVSSGTVDGRYYSIETRCPGVDPSLGSTADSRMLESAIDSLMRMRQAHSRPTRLTKELVSEMIEPTFQFAADHADAACAGRIWRLYAELAEILVGRTVCIGLMHGDFKMGNLLFDGDGRAAAIIDWDHAMLAGIPLFDLLQLVVFRIGEERGLTFVEIYRDYVVPWKLPFPWTSGVMRLIEREAMDQEAFLALRVAHYFYVLRFRLGLEVAQHSMWQARYLDTMINAFEVEVNSASACSAPRDPIAKCTGSERSGN